MSPEIIQKISASQKILTEATALNTIDNHVHLALISGESIGVYVFTPEHAKKLLLSLGHQIEVYEKAHGEIRAEWQPGMPSPITSKGV